MPFTRAARVLIVAHQTADSAEHISMLPLRLSRWLHLDLPRKVRGLGLPVTEVIGTERPVTAPAA